MDLNRANLEVLFENFRVEWTDAFNAAQETAVYERVAMIVPSTSSSTLHAWLNQVPIMREWVGDRTINNIESASFVVKNKKYENTIEMTREEIEDDQYGLYTPIVRLMAAQAAANPDALLIDTLSTEDNWGGDAAAFYGTARAYGANTISNRVTTAFGKSAFETAYITMTSYLGHKNQPLMVNPFALVHGPALSPIVFDVVKNPGGGVAGAAGTDGSSVQVAAANRNFGLVEPIMDKRLVGTRANYWFLLGEIAGIRGLVYQDRMPAEFQTARMSNDSDFTFITDKYQMGCRARGTAFKGLPHLIYAGFAS